MDELVVEVVKRFCVAPQDTVRQLIEWFDPEGEELTRGSVSGFFLEILFQLSSQPAY